MRIASSPTFRIAAGLRLAVLLGVAGSRAFRRLHSHGQDARLKRADGGLWLSATVQGKPAHLSSRQRFHPRSLQKKRDVFDLQNSLPSDLIWRMPSLKRRPLRLQITEPQKASAVTRFRDHLLQLAQ